jgi:hypothetical protein
MILDGCGRGCGPNWRSHLDLYLLIAEAAHEAFHCAACVVAGTVQQAGLQCCFNQGALGFLAGACF